MPAADRTVTAAVACLDAGRRLAVEQERPDLAARLDAARTRLASKSVPVAVVGEFKRGKSTLVNALLRYNVCPVDADIVTAVPTLVRYGEHTAVTGFSDPDRPDDPPRAESLALEDLPDAVSEFGRRDGRRLSSVEVRLRHRMLRSGLCLLDTPGVGGLDSAHGVVTLGALEVAQGVLFVTDASQELTAPELAFLKMVLERCPLAACVVTKTDLYPHWRRIVELDRSHLERAGLDLPVFGVSSFLRLHSRSDPALEEESGFRPLARWLAADVLGTADTRAARSAMSDVRFVAGQLGRQVEAERQVVARPQESARVVARLTENRERTERLTAPTATWQQALADQVQDLIADVEHGLRARLRDVTSRAEAVIDRGDPKDAWPDVDAWLRREVAAAVVAVYDEMGRRAEAVADDVAARFALEAGSAVSFERAAPTDVLDRIDVTDFTSPATGRLMTAFLAARSGAFVPTVLFAAASQLPVAATLTATLFLAPLALVLTAGIGAKVIRDERARQLAHRRQLAKAAARRYLDEVLFTVGRDCQHTLRLTQRQLRDEFHGRAVEMHRSSTVTLEAAQRAQDLGGSERGHRATSLDRHARQLRTLQRAVDAVASAVPPGVVAGRG